MNTTAGYIGESFWNFDTIISLLVLLLLFIAMCIPAIVAYKHDDKKQMWISIGCGLLGMFLLIPWIVSIVLVLKKYEMPAKEKGIIKPWIFMGDSLVLILIGVCILVRNYTQWGSAAGISLIIYGVGLQVVAFLNGKAYWGGLMVMAAVLVSCMKLQYTETLYVLYEVFAVAGAGLILCNVIGMNISTGTVGKILETAGKTLESVKEKQIEPTARAGRKMVRCENGHFYDFEKYGPHCPYCNPAEQPTEQRPVQQSEQRPVQQSEQRPIQQSEQRPVQPTEQRPVQQSEQQSEPYPVQQSEHSVVQPSEQPAVQQSKEPVVGWLVCVDGIYKGESFILKAGRNFIGRAKEMDICLKEDNSIAEYKQAAIIYEPKNRQFIVVPGEVRELCYVNDEVVLVKATMKANDVLSIGNSSLMLVPFCGEDFSW